MFVLDRRKGERFLIVGGNLRAHVKVLNVQDDQVRLGIRILAEVPVGPTDNEFREFRQADESNGGRKQDNGAPRRSRRPRRVWPPVELAHTGWY